MPRCVYPVRLEPSFTPSPAPHDVLESQKMLWRSCSETRRASSGPESGLPSHARHLLSYAAKHKHAVILSRLAGLKFVGFALWGLPGTGSRKT